MRLRLVVLPLLFLSACEEKEGTKTTRLAPTELATSLSHVASALEAATASFETSGIDAAARELVTINLTETVDPWGTDAEDESVINNPLFQGSGQSGTNPTYEGDKLLSDAGQDIGAMTADAVSIAMFERLAAWHAVVASSLGGENPLFEGPSGMRFAFENLTHAIGEARCASAWALRAEDPSLLAATCHAGFSLLSAHDALVALDTLLSELEALLVDYATLVSDEETAYDAFADAVASKYPEGEIFDAVNTARTSFAVLLGSTHDEEAEKIQAVLDDKLPALAIDVAAVRPLLRAGSVDLNEKSRGQYFVEVPEASLSALFADASDSEACAGRGFACLLSRVAATSHLDGHAFLELEADLQGALTATDWQGELADKAAAVRIIHRDLATRTVAVQAAVRELERVFASISNVLRTKHETAKNAIGNIR